MIRYTLRCDKAHAFESWFQDSAAYEKQAKRGLVTCPACGSTDIEKSIMAPRVSSKTRSGKSAPDAPAANTPAQQQVALISDQERELRAKLKELHDAVTSKADNVGEKFVEEARKMHYGETDQRPIYGQAAPDDAKALIDEGVEIFPLPVLPDDRN
jgi:hypothetical protein